MQLIALSAALAYEPLRMGSDYVYPTWAEVVGIWSALVALKIILGFALYHWYTCGFVSELWYLVSFVCPAFQTYVHSLEGTDFIPLAFHLMSKIF